MESSLVPFVLLFIIISFAIPASVARNAAKQNRTTHPSGRKDAPRAEPQAPAAPAPAQPASAERLSVAQPSITLPGHDDSVYQGSMNAVTGEGFDPCHDEQLSELTEAARPQAPRPRPAASPSGILPGWTADEVVRGFVMSEILNRKR